MRELTPKASAETVASAIPAFVERLLTTRRSKQVCIDHLSQDNLLLLAAVARDTGIVEWAIRQEGTPTTSSYRRLGEPTLCLRHRRRLSPNLSTKRESHG